MYSPFTCVIFRLVSGFEFSQHGKFIFSKPNSFRETFHIFRKFCNPAITATGFMFDFSEGQFPRNKFSPHDGDEPVSNAAIVAVLCV